MKNIIFFCILLWPVLAFAQAGIPQIGMDRDTTLPCGQSCIDIATRYLNTGGTDTYSVQQIPYQPLPYNTGTPILVRTDDLWSQVIHLPFSFCFFGTVYQNVIVGSNGALSFDTTNAGQYNSWQISGQVPANAPSDASILGPWQDIDPTVRGNQYSEIAGTYPYRYYKISWDSIPYYGDSNSACRACFTPAQLWASNQIILYETTNMIDIYIRNKDTLPAWNGGLAVEGIVNPTTASSFIPTVAYTVPGRNATKWTAQNDGWRFLPCGAGNFVSVRLLQGSTPIDSAYGDSTQTLLRHICPPSSPDSATTTTYHAEVTYSTCGGGSVTLYDSLHVTVPATGPYGNQNICQYTSTTLNVCGNGGTWAALPGNPSAVTLNDSAVSGFDSIGIYFFSYCNGGICDTVSVTVVTEIAETVYASICGTQTYTFHGTAYSAAGVYNDTLPSLTACDTIATLYLSVVSADTTQIYDSICQGSTYTFAAQVLNSTGTYTDVLSSVGGCDSLVVLNLVVDTPATPTITQNGNALIAYPEGEAVYLWYLNSGGVPVALTDSFVPTIPGSYIVSAGPSFTCLSTSQPYVIAGIDQIASSKMKVYPNPTNGNFIIESSGLAGKEYSITDVLGQQIAHGTLTQNKEQINMGQAAGGIYILMLNGNAIRLTISR